MHSDLVPPENAKLENDKERLQTPWTTEYDVLKSLKKAGHQVETIGVYSDLKVIRTAIEDFRPNIIFNLLEEFDGDSVFDQNVVSYLELMKVPYTGSNPRGLILARDKGLTKKILTYHRIKTPKFMSFPKNKRYKTPKELTYPLIVKCLSEEASLGISKVSIVNSEDKLKERINYIHTKFEVDAIAEEFIKGREFFVGVMGNYRLETLPVWELKFNKVENAGNELYSRQAKWNEAYRKRRGIESSKADLTPELEKRIQTIAKKTYKALSLNGYARIDMRMDEQENIFIIEANPNPNIAMDDEFAESSYVNKKYTYPKLLNKILRLGRNWFDGK
jgi:D-alanine-D-alanine ligase